jgi:hypothetical protein
MPLHLRWRAPRVTLLGLTAFCVCVCLLPTAAAGARGKKHLQATVSEESVTAPLQESKTEPAEEPATTSPPSQPSVNPPAEPSTSPPTESGASSRRERRHVRREAASASGCSIDLKATSSIVVDAAPLSLAGTLSCPEAGSASEQAITLYRKLAGTPGFDVAATTSTEADGAFQFALTGPEFNSVFYVRYDGGKSARVSVKVTPQVTISTPAAGAQLLLGSRRATRASKSDGSAVTFTGTVSPVDPGATVSLQREYRKGAWHRIGGGGVVDDEGKYSLVHTFFRPGEANIRVVVHSAGLEVTTASAPYTYEITRRAQQGTSSSSANPTSHTLTAVPSASTVQVGAQLSFTGTVLPAHEGQPVDLERESTGGGGYSVIAVGATSSSGAYSLAPTFTEAGSELLRVSVPGNSEFQSVSSEAFTIEVTPSA